ncbi:sugar porter family MFS transporter [Sphingosinicella sp. LHD-64]|uniref:sugar porter family MFS transporter n=1 Tax=Sphingosinicella sp. LHD-64 TaxID=3072139 RepID=UPI00280FAA90|nr:sugar porter family MFS transporter [Sphingosinicella sp. LHD-64]MDQ8758096.1 sugar porter family MFS transporter [Sphingosinicella sp. LHD-64]
MNDSPAGRANIAFIGAIVAVATIGGFMFGYDSGAVNGTQEGLRSAYGLTEAQLGLTVSSLLIGCAIGAFLAGRLADVIGRRNVMLLAAIAFLVSALVAGAAGSTALFVVARVLGGMAVGAASVLSPAYISEVTPAAIRGRLSSIQQIMIITGLTGAFVVNYLLAQHAGASTEPFWLGYPAWRWMYWMQAIPAAVFLVSLLFIPESPRYLVVKGRDADAERVLTRLFGPAEARAKVAEIRASLVADHQPRLSDLRNPATGKLRMIVWAGLGLAIFQQLVGINVIFYYGATLWQLGGFTEDQALQINVVSGAVSIAACIFTVLVIDRIGRKPLLMIGSAGMAVTLFAMVYAFANGTLDAAGNLQLAESTGIVALVAANLYVIFFNVSWGPVMWVMLGEMFPNQIRGSALAVCGLAQWAANFAISATFPWLAANIGLTITYSFYALSAVVSYVFVAKIIEETKGRELEEMTG